MADKEVIILGMAPSRFDCTWDVPVYACNNSYRQIAPLNGRLDKVFLAHTQVVDKDGDEVFDWKEMNLLADEGVDILNTHDVEGLKSRRYPFALIVNRFDTNYFSDTIAYMLAYILYEWTKVRSGKVILSEPDKEHLIRIYGVDMKTEDEYTTEKGGVEYWVGRAEGLGIKVWIHPQSELCKTASGFPYGTDILLETERMIQREEVKLASR